MTTIAPNPTVAAPTAAPHIPTHAPFLGPALPMLDLAQGTNLGEFHTSFGGQMGVQMQVHSNGIAGAAQGYATLADAQSALGHLSNGAHNGAIAIVSQNSRFYGVHTVGFSPEVNHELGTIHIGGIAPIGLAHSFAPDSPASGTMQVIGLVDGGTTLGMPSTI